MTERSWTLQGDRINNIQDASIKKLVSVCKQAHYVDVQVRINGEDRHYQADWIKHLTPIAPLPEFGTPSSRLVATLREFEVVGASTNNENALVIAAQLAANRIEQLERELADAQQDAANQRKLVQVERELAAPVSASGASREAVIDECISVLGDRLESLQIMTDRAGYTREGSDLAQRTSAIGDAINIVRALKTVSARQERK